MSQIVISTLPEKDWEKYRQIRLEAVKTSPTAFLNTYEDLLNKPVEKWQEDLLKSTKKDGAIYLFAFDDKKIVGMNAAYWNNKEKNRHVVEIFGVFVNPNYRGQGIGRLLMEEIIKEIKQNPQFKKIKLGVNAENFAALKLYQSCGLKTVGRLEKELKFGDKFCDEIIMEMIIG